MPLNGGFPGWQKNVILTLKPKNGNLRQSTAKYNDGHGSI